MNEIERVRELVELQGFEGLDDETLMKIEPWLRLSPAICMAVTAIGTILQSPVLIFGLLPFAVAGVFLKNHPFDLIYDLGLRFVTGGPRLPRYGAPRRFACALASVWLAVTGAAMMAGLVWTSLTLGLLFAAVAAVPVVSGLCVPSWIFVRLLGRAHPCLRRPVPEREEG